MKKGLVIVLISLLFLAGCEENNVVEIDGEKVNTKEMVHEHCSRQGTLEGGEVSLNYDIYYTGEILNIVRSIEKVSSTDSSILDDYEQAYKDIHAHYKNIKNYETEVIRTDDSVTSTILINYDKIDIQALIDLEGEEDNVFENKVPKVELWKSFAKKLGTTCTVIDEEL